MTTDTKLKELIINKLTTSQYDSIEEKDPNQLYIVTDAPGFDNTITKCLIKIPQDIKLELDDGTLILKAGSKVYVPNGFEDDGTTPKFDVVVIESDCVWSVSTTAGTRLALYTGGSLVGIVNTYCYSGDTAKMSSTTAYTYARFYNTETNKIYVGNSNEGSWVEAVNSLPICIFNNDDSGNVTSLDQTFNGFGYIGSTLFYLPNVQGKTANGLNSDGTYKGTDFTTTNVVTRTFSGDNGGRYIAIKGNLSISYNDYDGSNPAYYDKKINQFVRPGDSSPIWDDVCVFGLCTMTNGVISNFRPKTTFQAVDRNDSSWLSGLSMPSSRHTDLTLGASGSEYAAPANGWFCFISKATTASGQYCRLIGTKPSIRQSSYASGTNQYIEVILPVSSGQLVSVHYTAPVDYFKFIYAEGETI